MWVEIVRVQKVLINWLAQQHRMVVSKVNHFTCCETMSFAYCNFYTVYILIQLSFDSVAPFLPILNTAVSSSGKTSLNSCTDDTLPSVSSECTTQANIEIVPRFDWIQKTNEISLVFYTKALCNPGVIIHRMHRAPSDSQSKFDIIIQIVQTMHVHSIQLTDHVEFPPITTRINYETGKIECIFRKHVPALWTNFGLMTRKKFNDLSTFTYLYNVIKRVQITHDSYALILEPKLSLIQIFPIGYHITITATIEGKIYVKTFWNSSSVCACA